MKKFILFVSFFLIVFSAKGQTTEVKLKIAEVKLHPQGAEIIHTGTVEVKNVKKIIFTGLSYKINPQSISVKTAGGVAILSVTKRFNYLKPFDGSEVFLRLKDKLDSLKVEKENLESAFSAISGKLDFLSRIASAVSSDFNEAKKLVKYYYGESDKLRRDLLNTKRKLNLLAKEIEKVKKQIKETESKKNYVNEILVDIDPGKVERAEFRISYFSNLAFWHPIYELRTVGDKAELTLKAGVKQSTGLDWKDCRIVLSSRRLYQNNIKPELNVWYLDFERQRYFLKSAESAKSSVSTADEPTFFQMSESVQNVFAVEYSIKTDITILSNNKKAELTLAKYKLGAEYQYYAVPKLETAAFLKAKLSDWKNLNLLPGTMRVYYEGNYVGESRLNTKTVSDKLDVSLGRDDNVVVKREIVKDYTETKTFGSDLERNFTVSLSFENNKGKKIFLIAEENIPVSKHEDIKVELTEAAGGEFDAKKGIILWKVNLEPQSKKTIIYKYSVTYPGDKIINGL